MGVLLFLFSAVASGQVSAAPQSQPLPDNAPMEALRAGCDARNGWACDEMGRRYMTGLGVPQDDRRAREALERACGFNNAMGCSRLGFLTEEGRSGPADALRAVALYSRGCDGGEPFGCLRLGLMYANGRGVARDDVRAVGLYRGACDKGEVGACTNLGMMYQTSRGGLAPDHATSVALYKRACDGQDAIGCAHLALMYDLGQGVAKNVAAAIDLYTKACDMGGGSGACVMLGMKYANGQGIVKDAARALALYDRGCAAGESGACKAAQDARRPAAALAAPAVTPPPAAPVATALVFSTTQAELIWMIKPERKQIFEAAWKQMADALARSPETRLRQAARNMTLFKIASGTTEAYVTRLDPVIAGLSYQPGSLLTESRTLGEAERNRVHQAIADSLVSLNWLALDEVPLRGRAVSPRALATDGAAAAGPTANALSWPAISTTRAEVIWTIKSGQGAAFERFWQELVAGMERSSNPRLRQASNTLSLWRSTGTSLTYVLRIDGLLSGTNYDPASLTSSTFTQKDAGDLYSTLTRTVDAVNVLPLAPVP